MAISMNSTNVINLTGLTDEITNTYVNTATVAGSLLTSDGTSVTTFTLTYVSASDGDYQGSIPASTTSMLTEGATYIIRIVASVSGNQQTFEERDIASYTSA